MRLPRQPHFNRHVFLSIVVVVVVVVIIIVVVLFFTEHKRAIYD